MKLTLAGRRLGTNACGVAKLATQSDPLKMPTIDRLLHSRELNRPETNRHLARADLRLPLALHHPLRNTLLGSGEISMRRTWMMFALSATLCSCIFATILPSTAFREFILCCLVLCTPRTTMLQICVNNDRMSEAAETAALVSKAQTIVGAAGFIGVLISLFFSGASTRSASQQVRLSRHALISTDRAFVYSDGTLWVANVNAKTNIVERWLVSVKWKNFGATPNKRSEN